MKPVKNIVEEDDNFYKLNDDLLRHILNLLPTKDALKTSVLSSRWRNLWRCISNIDLHYFSFNSKDCTFSSSFESIDRLLVHHDSSDIKRFRFSTEILLDPICTHRWISKLIKHNVEELLIVDDSCLYLSTTFTLPLCLFKCESLTVFEIDIPNKSNSILLGSDSSLFSVHLPCLKILKLSRVVFLNNHSTQHVFSNIPKLQQLCLYRCDWSKVESLIIDIPTLEGIDVYINNRFCPLMFLESVKEAASLHMGWDSGIDKWHIYHKDLPLFMNLKHLEISAEKYNFFGVSRLDYILMFLYKMPNIESFTITVPRTNIPDGRPFFSFEDDWSKEGGPRSCAINRIKKFTIIMSIDPRTDFSREPGNYYYYYATAVDLTTHLMNHSQSLKTLEINWLYYSLYPTTRALYEIRSHPRYSELKSFSFSSYDIIPKPVA